MRFFVSNGTTPFLQQFLLRFAKTRVAPSPPYSILICRKTCDQLTTQLQPKSSCKRVFSDAVRSLHSIVSVVSSVLSPADTIPYSHYLTTDCVFLRPCQVFGDMRLQQNNIIPQWVRVSRNIWCMKLQHCGAANKRDDIRIWGMPCRNYRRHLRQRGMMWIAPKEWQAFPING